MYMHDWVKNNKYAVVAFICDVSLIIIYLFAYMYFFLIAFELQPYTLNMQFERVV